MRRTLFGAILLLATIVPSVLFADSASAVAPANDSFFAAQPIQLNSVVGFFDNTDATTEIDEPVPSCQASYVRSVWYKYTADANRTLQVVTAGSNFDTVLAVYSTTNPFPGFGNLTPVACDDDGGLAADSIATFAALAGNTYYIQASGCCGWSGNVIVGFGEIPTNDNLASAQAVAPPASSAVRSAVATVELGEPSCFTTRTVWYKATLPAGSYRAYVDAGTGDSGLGVYTGPAVSPTFPSLTQIECDDDGGAGLSSQVIIVTGGGTFYFQVGTLIQGNFTFTLNVIPDLDGDGVPDQSDNCPNTDNGPLEATVIGVGNQYDNDADGLAGTQPPFGATWGGDACDFDDDNDGIVDTADAFCPFSPEDIDGWQDGDGCPDTDNDGDGICDPGQTSVACTGSDSGKYCFDPAVTLACHIAPASDCRNVAEDIDNFKDSDGCPEPDNDNDGFQDFADSCPGSLASAGTDGMLGSPQDLNHNGIKDVTEAVLTTDDVVKTFEDYDTVLDGDGCHDSPGEDFDSDGYTDDVEAGFPLCGNGVNNDNLDDAVIDDGCPGGPAAAGTFSEGAARIGTNPGYPCGNPSWPSDLLSTGLSENKLDVQDIISFVAPIRRLDKSPPNAAFDARWDLAPGANTPFPSFISIFDITTMLNGTPGSPAYPPMFAGPRAFGKVCPLAAQ